MAGSSYKGSQIKDVDQFINDSKGLGSTREQEIGQHIGYRYDVNLLPDYGRLTPFLKNYMEFMGWEDLNWLEDVHMGYEEGQPAIFDRNVNGWVRIPEGIKLPDNQQDRDMLARACGKTNIHSLEPEDLAALTMEASAMCKVPLAGTNYVVGMDGASYHNY